MGLERGIVARTYTMMMPACIPGMARERVQSVGA